MKIAVVGGGIYGVCAALKLADNHEVHLFERYNDILKAASGINQYRLHRGYHYPRSNETASASNQALHSFKQEFSEAVIEHYEHHYCIAKEKSFINSKQYLQFLAQNSLEHEHVELDILNKDKIELCLKVKESLYDLDKLRSLCWNKLKDSKVKVHLNHEVKMSELSSYDYKVIAAYANINSLLHDYPEHQRDYQFELCEKPVELPDSLKSKSIVVMDGPFMCLDPLGTTGYSLMGNVVHAIHSTNNGKFPVIDEKYHKLLNNGIIKNPSITNFDLFIESASEFIPEIKKAEHIGSMYTIRTVLPNVEDTDKRPTRIYEVNDSILTIFAGKIGNSVTAANQVKSIVDSKLQIKETPKLAL